jgi:hypothetical protein
MPMDARVWTVGGNNISEGYRDKSLRPAQSKFRSKKFFGPYLGFVCRRPPVNWDYHEGADDDATKPPFPTLNEQRDLCKMELGFPDSMRHFSVS